MPPMPQVKLYLVASRLTLAGCRWKKTLERTLRARLRGSSSCLTRNMERKSWVFSGSFSPSTCCLVFSLSVSRSAAASAWTFSRTLVLFSLLPPFSSGIRCYPFRTQIYVACDACYFRARKCFLAERAAALHVQKSSRIVEMVDAGAGIVHVEPAGVHRNFSRGVEHDVGAVHGTRRWTLEIDPFTVVAAAVAGALEFIFRGLPFGRAAKVRAAGVDHEQAIGLAHDPDAVGHQIALINAQAKIRWEADVEDGVGFVERAGKEETEEHQEVDAQVPPNKRPDNSTATSVDGFCRSLLCRRLGCDHSRRYRRRCGLTRLPFRNFCHRPVDNCYCKRKSMSREFPYQMLLINTGLYDLRMAVSRVSRLIFSVRI